MPQLLSTFSLLFVLLAFTSCAKEENMASIVIEVNIVKSERFELLALPINYIRTFDVGGTNRSIGTLGASQTRSLALLDNNDPDFTIFEGPTFPRTIEGIDPSFGLALLRDMQTGEEFELPVCEPRMIPLQAITDISTGSKFRIVLPFDIEALHEIEAITYIDLTAVTAQIEEL